MKGDFTRFTHDPRKHYSRVLKQQGRVDLDADWNEAMEIVTHLDRVRNVDVIGRCGVPYHGGGFRVELGPDGEPAYTPGRIYVDGILVERHGDDPIPLADQHDLPGYAPPTDDGTYVAYVDVWERHITALEDPEIREPALGGPDTTTRVRTVAQVRLARLGADGPVAGLPCPPSPSTPTTGWVAARTTEEEDTGNPCIVPAGAGYRGLENRLYRVEIHSSGRDADGNPSGPVTFKWSRDNGSVVLPVESVAPSGTRVTLARLGPDEVLTVRVGDLVEVLGDTTELHGRPGTLTSILPDGIDRARLEVTLADDVSGHASEGHLKMRRWDHRATPELALVDGALPLPPGPFELEDGVVVEFDPAGTYNVGDYWLIPARTREGTVLWPTEGTPPAPVPLLPRGIRHHTCTLALLRRTGGAWTEIRDCRRRFPPLTELEGGGCCVTVAPGDDIQLAVDAVLAEGGGCVSLCAGVHLVDGPIRVAHGSDLVIQGTGSATLVRFAGVGNDGHGGWVLHGSRRITLREMAMVTASAPALVTVLHDADLAPSREIALRDATLVNATSRNRGDDGVPLPCCVRVGHADTVSVERCRMLGDAGIVALWGNELARAAQGGGGGDPDGQVPPVGVVPFDDLPEGTQFGVGGSATSAGIPMRGAPFTFSNGDTFTGGFARVQTSNLSGGSGRELQVNNILVEFAFPAAYTDVRLSFGEFGGNVNLRVNGVLRNVNDFQDLSGQVVAGVRILVQPGPDQRRNRLVLTRETEPVRDFALGGQELFIDDVAYRGPVVEEPLPEPVPAGEGVHRLLLRDTGIRYGSVGVLAARAEGWRVEGCDVAPLPDFRVAPPATERPGELVNRAPGVALPEVARGAEAVGAIRRLDTGGDAGARGAADRVPMEVGSAEMQQAVQAVLDFSRAPGESPEADGRATAAALGTAADVLFALPTPLTRGVALLAFLWRDCAVRTTRLRGARGAQAWWWMGGGVVEGTLEGREAAAHAFWLHAADWSRNRVGCENGVALSFGGSHRARIDGNRIRGMVGIATAPGTAAQEGLADLVEALRQAYGLPAEGGAGAAARQMVEDTVPLLGLQPLADALDAVLDALPGGANLSASALLGAAVLNLLSRGGTSLPLPVIDLRVTRNDVVGRHVCVQLEGFLPLGPLRVGHNRLHTLSGQALRIEVQRFLANPHLLVLLVRMGLAQLVETLTASVERIRAEGESIPGLLGVMEAMLELVRRWQAGAEGLFELDTRVEGNTIRSLRTAVETNLFEATVQDNHITLQERPLPRRQVLTGRIFGTVRLASGAPLPGAQVRIDGTALATLTDASGGYQFMGVPAGSYVVRATLVGAGSVAAAVTLAAGAQVEVPLVFGATGGIRGFQAGEVLADRTIASRAAMASVANTEIADVMAALDRSPALSPLGSALREGTHTDADAWSAWMLGSGGALATAAARTAAASAVTTVAGATSDPELQAVASQLNTALRNNDGAALATLLPRFVRILFGLVDTQGILVRGAGCRIVDNHVIVPEDGRPESRALGGIQLSVAYANLYVIVVLGNLLLQRLGREEPVRMDPLLGVTDTLVDNNEVLGGEGHGISVQGVSGAPDLLFDLHVRGNQVRGMGGAGILCNEHAWVVGLEAAGNHVAGCGRLGGFSRIPGGIVIRTAALVSLLGNQVSRCGQGVEQWQVAGVELDTLYGLRMNDNRITANGSEAPSPEDGGVILREVYGEAQLHDNQVTFNRGSGLQWTNSARADEPPLFPQELAQFVFGLLRAPGKGSDLRRDERASVQGNVFQAETAAFPLVKILNLDELSFTGNSLNAGAGSAPLAELEAILRGIVNHNQTQTGAALAMRIQKMIQGVAVGNVGNRPIDVPTTVQHGFNVPPAT